MSAELVCPHHDIDDNHLELVVFGDIKLTLETGAGFVEICGYDISLNRHLRGSKCRIYVEV